MYEQVSVDFSSVVGATDVYDGDISDRVKIISNTFNNSYAGEYAVNCKVTNSFGDTSEISFNAIVVDDDPDIKRVKLNRYITYTKVGEEVDFEAHILSLNGSPQARLTIDSSEFDPNKPGVYSVYYKISDLIRARLLVVVEEAE